MSLQQKFAVVVAAQVATKRERKRGCARGRALVIPN